MAITSTQSRVLAELLTDHRWASAEDISFSAGVLAAMILLLTEEEIEHIETQTLEMIARCKAGEDVPVRQLQERR